MKRTVHTTKYEESLRRLLSELIAVLNEYPDLARELDSELRDACEDIQPRQTGMYA